MQSIELPAMDKTKTSPQSLDEALDSIVLKLSQWTAPQPMVGFLRAFEGEKSNSPEREAAWELHKYDEEITKLIVADERFLGNAVRMIGTFNGCHGFYPSQVAGPLLHRAVQCGSSTGAIRWLQKVLSTESASGAYVTALWNVPVDGEVQLTEDVKLVPFAAVPDGPIKAIVQNAHRRGGLVHTVLDFHPPSSALVVNYLSKPWLVDAEAKGYVSDYMRVYERINEIILALTAVGPRAPVLAAAWYCLDDPDLNHAVSSGRSGQMMELLPGFRNDWPALDVDLARDVVGQFLRMNAKDKPKVSTALDRLQRALMRHQIGDRAVEIAIALETLLGDTGNSEMTHKVCVRGARFLGGKKDERTRYHIILKRAYDIRSKLVHTGIQETGSIAVGKGLPKIKAEAVIDEACQLCAKLIRKVLALGAVPDWASFDITDPNIE